MGADEDGDQVVPAGRVPDHRHRYPPDGRAVSLGELHAVPAQGSQALAPGEKRDVVLSGLMEAAGEQAAGNPGAVHEQLHETTFFRIIAYVRFISARMLSTSAPHTGPSPHGGVGTLHRWSTPDPRLGLRRAGF